LRDRTERVGVQPEQTTGLLRRLRHAAIRRVSLLQELFELSPLDDLVIPVADQAGGDHPRRERARHLNDS
jgi:hypothetical protein